MHGFAALFGCVAALLLALPGVAGADPVAIRPAVVPTDPGPEQATHADAIRYDHQHPDSAPPGANDFGCRPAPGTLPVVLAHGTDSSAYSDWAALSPQLKRAGHCVFALDYGGKVGAQRYGTEDIAASAGQLRAFVDRVRSATGAQQVDLVGYSQGATVGRYYVNKLGGADAVRRWVGLASPSYGGALFGIVALVQAIPGGVDRVEEATSLAVVEQLANSPFLTDLNKGGDTVAGVEYTTIGSRYDEIIQPTGNIALRGPGATNIVVQDLCPIDMTGHFNVVYDPYSLQLVLNTLDPAHAVVPPCELVPLGRGIPEVILATH